MRQTKFFEVKKPRQTTGYFRRIFWNDYFDLFVSYDLGRKLVGFQLCYAKNSSREKALIWREGRGYCHYNGGDEGSGIKQKPRMWGSPTFAKEEIGQRFTRAARELDQSLREFILRKILEYPDK
jgi:hypothetical protein